MIYDILSKQGKTAMITKIKQGAIDFEMMIMSENYYLTNLDLWLLASKMNLPIIIFTGDKLINLGLTLDWLILGGEPATDKYYCMRSTDDGYNLITPSILVSELNGPAKTATPSTPPTFDEFIKNYKIVIRRPGQSSAPRVTGTTPAGISFKTEPMPV
jgi:hypothetical protein